MNRVDLPSGAWVELIDPADLTEKKRRRVKAKAMAAQGAFRDDGTLDRSLITGPAVEAILETQDVLAEVMISAWSFPTEITTDAITDLVGGDYDAIIEAVKPSLDAVMGGAVPSTP